MLKSRKRFSDRTIFLYEVPTLSNIILCRQLSMLTSAEFVVGSFVFCVVPFIDSVKKMPMMKNKGRKI